MPAEGHCRPQQASVEQAEAAEIEADEIEADKIKADEAAKVVTIRAAWKSVQLLAQFMLSMRQEQPASIQLHLVLCQPSSLISFI